MEKEDTQLKQFLQEGHKDDSPSMSFTPNVMRKIELKRAAKLKPIIGKWAWLLIAFSLVGVISIPILSNWSSLSFSAIDPIIPNIKLSLTILLMSGIFILFDELYLRKRRARL